MEDSCPCSSGVEFDECCAPFLDDDKAPTTAVALMRSRYTAFVHEDVDYLARTWHPDTCPPAISAESGDRWTGLEIISSEKGKALDSEGVVEFAASHTGGVLMERSRFARVGTRWTYVDGEVVS